MFGRLPNGFSRTFACVLNAMSRPFHEINYLGGCVGALVLHGPRLAAQVNRTIASLHRHLEHESVAALDRGMALPTRWDPYFRDRMTLLEVYHYGTQHFDFHRRQLTLLVGRGDGWASVSSRSSGRQRHLFVMHRESRRQGPRIPRRLR
jgi:hypothetical protein